MGAGCCKSDISKVIVHPNNKVTNGNINAPADNEFIEAVVCHENDIGENEMKSFEFEAPEICTKVLIVKQKGKISAIGTKCSHSGALLSMGVLGDGRIRCPWHGACFNIETGDIEDYPGQDSIPCYQVNIEKGAVKVRAKKSALNSHKRPPVPIGRDLVDLTTYVIIGGGPSGAICAENLRPNGFGGRIVMVCKEEYPPYDRVKVSKAMDSDAEAILLRTEKFYDGNDIELLLGVSAISLNSENKEISLSNGEILNYDKVYIATGSSALLLNIPGMDLKNIMTLRNITDAQQVMEKVNKNSHVVVLGVSFTGMEACSFLVNKVAKITAIGRDSVPFRHSFGKEVGQVIIDLFKEKNVQFEMNNGIKKCIGNANGEIESVELNDGRMLKADILIVAVGSTLNTEFLKGSGIMINDNGSIDTNEYLETNVQDIYVGGDIANAPIFMTGKRENIGHYPLAQYHGKIAALNMCGKKEELKAVPFFWTMLFGKSFRYAGHGTPFETKIVGSLEEFKFVVYYIDETGKVISVSSCTYDPVVAQFAEFLAQGKILMKSEIENGSFDWIKRINHEREI